MSGASFDPFATFRDSLRIRVALVPVGNISKAKFDEYATLIEQFDCIELADVTRDPNDKSKWMCAVRLYNVHAHALFFDSFTQALGVEKGKDSL